MTGPSPGNQPIPADVSRVQGSGSPQPQQVPVNAKQNERSPRTPCGSRFRMRRNGETRKARFQGDEHFGNLRRQ